MSNKVSNDENKIDFIVTWVDGSDLRWQEEKERYQGSQAGDSRAIRYRNWDTLKYWFRGIEKNADWINQIHFVTWGHVPEWLNVTHPKLNIVKHTDFIPKEYLPTFNSRVIELHFHRIKNLSEKFVYFNDDMFILQQLKPEELFQGKAPKDSLILDNVTPTTDTFNHTLYNNLAVINKYFSKKDFMKENISKVFTLKYKRMLIKNLLLYPWKQYTGFYTHHLPIPYLKATFEHVWSLEEEELIKTSESRFRNKDNLNHFLMRYYQLADNNFVPSEVLGKYFELSDDNIIFNSIKERTFKMICINDKDDIADYEGVKKKLISSFETIFPEKSSFEK